MKKRPHILITNDDGIQAPGIHYLWSALRECAHLSVVAPHSEQSAVGMGLTLRAPLHVEKVSHFQDARAWSITGTPTDCVRMGLGLLVDPVPDLIVSGINCGTNAGRGLLYSGTVAGVIEGVLRGIPGIAFSCVDFDTPNYEGAVKYITSIVKHVLDNPLPHGTLLNVNFPDQPIQGVKLTRQGKEYWKENPSERVHPIGKQSYYWLGVQVAEFEEEEDCDIMWLRKGYAAAVPIHIGQLTDIRHLQSQKEHFEQLRA